MRQPWDPELQIKMRTAVLISAQKLQIRWFTYILMTVFILNSINMFLFLGIGKRERILITDMELKY